MSFTETLVILVVAMIVFGPKRMPEMARKLGKWMGMLRRASDEFKRQIMTMDQAVDDSLNSATSELDHLLPTDEELGQVSDVLPYEPELPTASPDELWGEEPVAGGLPQEEPATPPEPPAAPAPSPASGSAAKTSAPPKPKAPEDTAPRSLGLSPTRKEPRRG